MNIFSQNHSNLRLSQALVRIYCLFDRAIAHTLADIGRRFIVLQCDGVIKKRGWRSVAAVRQCNIAAPLGTPSNYMAVRWLRCHRLLLVHYCNCFHPRIAIKRCVWSWRLQLQQQLANCRPASLLYHVTPPARDDRPGPAARVVGLSARMMTARLRKQT